MSHQELDAWLAEHLDVPCFACRTAFTEHPSEIPSNWHPYSTPDLSGSWEGAGLVLPAMVEEGWSYALYGGPNGETASFRKTISGGRDLERHELADTLPMAVGLAAKAALEADGTRR